MKPSRIKEYRIKNGSLHLVEKISKYTSEELVIGAYLPLKNPDFKQFVSLFEKHIILAKIDPERFINTRYKETQKLCEHIRKKNQWKMLADFTAYVHKNLNHEGRDILYIYESLLMDTVYHITPFGKTWYGMSGDNPLFQKDYFGAYDAEAWELNERLDSPRLTEKEKKSLIHRLIEVDKKTYWIRVQERNVMNVVYSCIPLINESNEEFIFPGTDWFDHTRLDFCLPKPIKETEEYKEMLSQRSYLLDSEGVSVQCFNAGMIEEICFLEEFLDHGMIVLYRVTENSSHKHTIGFFDLRDGFFYSLWDNATTDNGTDDKVHTIAYLFKNFVLELYSYLTCSLDKTSPRLKMLKSPEEAQSLEESQVGIYCRICEEKEVEGATRKQYASKILHHVRPFIRRGNPSEMALANAQKWGLVLEPGYTFVKEHMRGRIKEESFKRKK